MPCALIQDELEKKYVGLVQSYGADLKTVQELFLQNRDSPPISWNLPPIAGALTWCRGLVDRIQIPMAKLQQLDRTILDREEAKEVAKVSEPEEFARRVSSRLQAILLCGLNHFHITQSQRNYVHLVTSCSCVNL